MNDIFKILKCYTEILLYYNKLHQLIHGAFQSGKTELVINLNSYGKKILIQWQKFIPPDLFKGSGD